jgi:predicted nucleic acid-binding protein
MIIVDSCGWLEWFSDGVLAPQYKNYLESKDKLIVPTIVLYEVYKVMKREVGEEKALLAFGHMKNSEVIAFNENLALQAADISLLYNLAMADAIVYAATLECKGKLVTSDLDLQGLPQVTFIAKESGE